MLFPKCYGKKLINMICDKIHYHKLFKQTNNKKYYYAFSKLRALCKLESKLRDTSHTNYIESQLSRNPKSFWNFINNLNKINGISAEMKYNNLTKKSDPVIADLFKKNFNCLFNY